MTIGTPLLAAGIADLMGVIVPIVFLIIYVLNHLLAPKGNRPPDRNPPRPPPDRAERPLQERPPQGQPPAGQTQLNAEIEQFLKRAAGRREERTGRAKAPPKARAKAVPKPPAPRRDDVAVDVEPIERREFGSVAASVAKHLGNRGFSQRAEHLASEVSQSDEQMQEHVQKVFSHRVGTLDSTLSAAPAAAEATGQQVTGAAASLAAVLASPQGMRQAVILSEILERPEHRW